ncbi:protein of unknown function [Clostridium beijerinckii]|nr:protein of unknown function [Clostridium beijerinckii]
MIVILLYPVQSFNSKSDFLKITIDLNLNINICLYLNIIKDMYIQTYIVKYLWETSGGWTYFSNLDAFSKVNHSTY